MPGPSEFITARLDFRRWQLDDAAPFFTIWGDPRVIWWGPALDLAAAAAALERIHARCADDSRHGWWALFERATNALIGSVALQPAPLDGELELGWHIAFAHHGRGFATEAARALVDRSFAAGIRRVVATVIPLNGASIAVCHKLGMQAERIVERNGCDHILYVLERGAIR